MTLYLIAHKVSGEPALDVAVMLDQTDEDGEIMWIIPTSGHRAFPYWQIELSAALSAEGPGPMPDPWPDHYPEPSPAKVETQSLLAVLGLAKPKPQVKRKV